jgi:hypothetical protein
MIGVSCGSVAVRFINRKPGPLNHARWLTAAIIILMLYRRTVNPTDTLTLIVKYIQAVYGKVWFRVKAEKSFTKAPEVLFDMIQDTKAVDIDSKLFNIVAPVLRRNAFSCLEENFLASLLYSDDPDHRQHAVDKILQIRAGPRQPVTETENHVPPLNFDARNWGAMINIMSMNCQEPPCTTKISDEDLVAMTTSTSYVWEKRHKYIVAKSV